VQDGVRVRMRALQEWDCGPDRRRLRLGNAAGFAKPAGWFTLFP
jgi:hypothetical protein